MEMDQEIVVFGSVGWARVTVGAIFHKQDREHSLHGLYLIRIFMDREERDMRIDIPEVDLQRAVDLAERIVNGKPTGPMENRL